MKINDLNKKILDEVPKLLSFKSDGEIKLTRVLNFKEIGSVWISRSENNNHIKISESLIKSLNSNILQNCIVGSIIQEEKIVILFFTEDLKNILGFAYNDVA